MLVLSRTREQSISIGEDVEIQVLEISGRNVRLGIRAPRHVKVLRSELAPRCSELAPQDMNGSLDELVHLEWKAREDTELAELAVPR